MIKNISFFRRFLLQNKDKQIFTFSVKQFNPVQEIKNKTLTQKPEQILKIFQYDTNNHYFHFTYSKSLFQNALQKKKYLPNSILEQTIQKACKYPQFYIEKKSLQEFYILVCDNIHLKTNQFLQKCLLFSLHTDKNAVHSPIFIQFIKFYVKDFVQLIKVQLSVDLSEESISNGIKLLFLRVIQRGFLSRKPAYSRQLYIKNREQVLLKLIQNKPTSQTLMIKKLNFQIFMDIKCFYEKQMTENLYHQKHKLLMNKMSKIVKVLCFRSSLTQNQNKFLRELIMKLHIANKTLQNLGIIHLYLFWKQQKLQKDYQPSQLVDEFINAIDKKIENLQINNQNSTILNEKQQLLKILINFKVSPKLQGLFQSQISKYASSIFIKNNFQSFVALLLKYQNLLIWLQKIQCFQQLTLDQIEQISIKFSHKSSKISLNCLTTILSKDIVEIGGRHLQIFLKVYKATSKIQRLQQSTQQSKQIQNSRKTLIQFVFRFLSDHHQEFPIKEYQKILLILFNKDQLKKDLVVDVNVDFNSINFNDDNNNYPDSIFQQIKQYTKKISLMLSDDLQQALKQFYDEKPFQKSNHSLK